MSGRNDKKNFELKRAAQSCSKVTDLFKKGKAICCSCRRH